MTAQHLPIVNDYPRMSRRAVIRATAAALLFGACAGSVTMLEHALGLTFNKPPMPLSKPLPLLNPTIGTHYVADGPDGNMEGDVLDVLGTKDVLLRVYRDVEKKSGEVGEKLYLNLNYYDTGEATPHVPEKCWAGSGLVEKGGTRHIFTVPNVRRKDGSVIDLRMTMVSFLPGVRDGMPVLSDDNDEKKLLNVAYVFHVNGNYVATPKEVLSTFWKAENKHAYHCKIEVALKGQYCQPEEAEKIIGEFVRQAIPEIEGCLPDPRLLNVDLSAPAVPRSSGG